jgi:hypothetical protein
MLRVICATLLLPSCQRLIIALLVGAAAFQCVQASVSRLFTASFSTESIEPTLIEGVLNRACADPVGVLQAAGI